MSENKTLTELRINVATLLEKFNGFEKQNNMDHDFLKKQILNIVTEQNEGRKKFIELEKYEVENKQTRNIVQNYDKTIKKLTLTDKKINWIWKFIAPAVAAICGSTVTLIFSYFTIL